MAIIYQNTMPTITEIEKNLFDEALQAIYAQDFFHAYSILGQLVLKNPGDIRAKINLCIVMVNMQMHEEALELLADKNLARYGPKYHFLYANALVSVKRIYDAEQHIRKIIGTPECQSALILNMSIIALEFNDFQFAGKWLRIAIYHYPTDTTILHQYIYILERLDYFRAQIVFYNKLIALEPTAENYGAKAYCHFKLLQYQESLDSAEQGLAIEPMHGRCLSSKATALRWVGKPYQSYQVYQFMIQNNVLYDSAESNYALLLETLDRNDEALEILERQLQSAPNEPTLRFFRAQINLRLGRFVEGFKDYQFRWFRSNHVKTYGSQRPGPFWHGEDLTGKSLYVHHEQGYGDTILFCRFLPMVKQLTGARAVFFDAQPKMLKLMAQMEGIDGIFHPKESQPVTDYTVSLLSLPAFLPLVRDGWVPSSAGYIKSQYEADIKYNLGDKLKVGIVWRGNPDQPVEIFRHCPIDNLKPLIARKDIQLFNFQPEACSDELEQLGIREIWDLKKYISDDFTLTAAIINKMDVMITTCTAIANLAGAMGKTTLLMAPWMADWRWGTYTMKKSWWYDSVEIYRQRALFEWQPVIADIMNRLDEIQRARV